MLVNSVKAMDDNLESGMSDDFFFIILLKKHCILNHI